MATDTGETTAAINARMNERALPDVMEGLREGGTLIRPARLDCWYLDMGAGHHKLHNRGGLTRSFVKKLERDGVIRHVGVDRYGLVQDAGGGNSHG